METQTCSQFVLSCTRTCTPHGTARGRSVSGLGTSDFLGDVVLSVLLDWSVSQLRVKFWDEEL